MTNTPLSPSEIWPENPDIVTFMTQMQADLAGARDTLGLNSTTTDMQVKFGTWQQFVTSDTIAPQFHQSRKRDTGGGDVSTGAVIGKWSISGWLNDSRRFAGRVTWFVHTAIGSVLRAKMKINVTNSSGNDWPAFQFSEQGFLGIGDSDTSSENDPACSLDVAGQIAGDAISLRARPNAQIASGGKITVTGQGYVQCTNSGAIREIKSSSPHIQRVIISTATGTVTLVHDASKLRLKGGVNQSIVANQSAIELIRVSAGLNIWQQVG